MTQLNTSAVTPQGMQGVAQVSQNQTANANRTAQLAMADLQARMQQEQIKSAQQAQKIQQDHEKVLADQQTALAEQEMALQEKQMEISQQEAALDRSAEAENYRQLNQSNLKRDEIRIQAEERAQDKSIAAQQEADERARQFEEKRFQEIKQAEEEADIRRIQARMAELDARAGNAKEHQAEAEKLALEIAEKTQMLEDQRKARVLIDSVGEGDRSQVIKVHEDIYAQLAVETERMTGDINTALQASLDEVRDLVDNTPVRDFLGDVFLDMFGGPYGMMVKDHQGMREVDAVAAIADRISFPDGDAGGEKREALEEFLEAVVVASRLEEDGHTEEALDAQILLHEKLSRLEQAGMTKRHIHLLGAQMSKVGSTLEDMHKAGGLTGDPEFAAKQAKRSKSQNKELVDMMGRVGKTITDLRPEKSSMPDKARADRGMMNIIRAAMTMGDEFDREQLARDISNADISDAAKQKYLELLPDTIVETRRVIDKTLDRFGLDYLSEVLPEKEIRKLELAIAKLEGQRGELAATAADQDVTAELAGLQSQLDALTAQEGE